MTKKRPTSARSLKTGTQSKRVARQQASPKKAAGLRQTSKAPAKSDRRGGTDKGKVPKVIRDSFTMPVFDYDLIGALKKKCLALGIAVKKSELLRAGLHALGRITEENLLQVVAAVESVRTGRPPGKKKKKKKYDRSKGKNA